MTTIVLLVELLRFRVAAATGSGFSVNLTVSDTVLLLNSLLAAGNIAVHFRGKK